MTPKEHSVTSFIFYLLTSKLLIPKSIYSWGELDDVKTRDKESLPTFRPVTEVSQKATEKHPGYNTLRGLEGNCSVTCLIHAPGLYVGSFFGPLF